MTAQNYIALTSDDLGANKIFRAATASALDSNPVAIAQRGTDAPWLNGIGAITAITSGSGNWTVPTGVYRIKVTAVGQGGGRGNTGSAGTNGDDTTFGSITAGGGGGGVGGSDPSGGSAGLASGGNVNLNGFAGALTGGPTVSALFASYGVGGVGEGNGGSAATVIKVFSVEPGDTIAYSVGDGVSGYRGSIGIIFIEY